MLLYLVLREGSAIEIFVGSIMTTVTCEAAVVSIVTTVTCEAAVVSIVTTVRCEAAVVSIVTKSHSAESVMDKKKCRNRHVLTDRRS
jgi:hypothetical protein